MIEIIRLADTILPKPILISLMLNLGYPLKPLGLLLPLLDLFIFEEKVIYRKDYLPSIKTNSYKEHHIHIQLIITCLLNILHLFSHFFQLTLAINYKLGNPCIIGFGTDGVDLAVHFLDEKVQPPAHRLLSSKG